MNASEKARRGYYVLISPPLSPEDRRRKNEDLRLEFYRDLCKDHNLDPDSKIAQLIWEKSWERGHSHGFSEVAIEFDEYIDFVNAVRSLCG